MLGLAGATTVASSHFSVIPQPLTARLLPPFFFLHDICGPFSLLFMSFKK